MILDMDTLQRASQFFNSSSAKLIDLLKDPPMLSLFRNNDQDATKLYYLFLTSVL